tara:strand:- start:767 stop:1135 length:369 start_codon:yes stop_codon:yes gene_type:complete
MQETYLKIQNIKLWARVGVLDKEREFGQLFSLDLVLWSDFEKCALTDDVNETIDYSSLISDIKVHSKNFSCKTIEKYSSEILNLVVKRYKPTRLEILLTKCKPPIIGFDGQVTIMKSYERQS